MEVKTKGRPKGLPKTGGRKPGTKNKRTVWLRDEFERIGFDWGAEFMKAFQKGDLQKVSVLSELIPYLAARIKEREAQEETPEEPQGLSDIPQEELTKQLKAVN